MSGLVFHGDMPRHTTASRPLGSGLQRSLLTAGVLAAGLAASGPASADSGSVQMQWLNAPTIKVESDGSKYTKVAGSPAPIQGALLINVDAEISGRVKSWESEPILTREKDVWVPFPNSGGSATYSIPRPKTVNTAYPFSIPKADYAGYVVEVCNLSADDLRGQGLSDDQIFGQDREYKVAVWGTLDYETTGISGTPTPTEVKAWESYPKVTVICQSKAPTRVPTANDPTRTKPQVKAANLVVKGQDSMSGACSMTLQVGLETVEPLAKVKFRFESNDGQKSDVKSVITDGSAFGQYAFDYPLPAGGTKSGQVRIIGVGENFSSPWRDYEVQCGSPAQDVVSVLPPQAVSVEAHLTGDEVMHRGMACPAKAKIYGVMKGRGDVDGGAALLADGKLQKLQQYSIEDGQTIVVQGDYDFDWTKTQLPQQNVKFTFNIANKGDLVDQVEATQNFTCRQIKTSGVASNAVGGVAGDLPQPLPSQQQAATGMMVQTPAQALGILAPKGPVRRGEIRLSGAQPGALYVLRFFRKDAAGYTAVASARLPREMKGPRARFSLAALTGGNAWRLQVCPAGAQPAACRTSDFRLPRIGGLKGKTAPAQPQTPQAKGTVIVVPGALK